MIVRALLCLLFVIPSFATELPQGYWPLERSQPILDLTAQIELAPDLSGLTNGEREAVRHLLSAGEIMHQLYEISRHHQAASAEAALLALHQESGSKASENLLELYRLFEGPIATTLDNERVPFVPADPPTPGKNVYPWGIDKGEIERWLTAHPDDRDEILAERTVVRRATAENLEADLEVLARHPVLDVLHPELRDRLAALAKSPDPAALYAVPYPVAYSSALVAAYHHVRAAANSVERDDPEFAGYLRNRARDLLTNDYESGDASWVTGRFGRLNVQIGAYETYDDALFGTKAFHSLSLLLRNEDATRELEEGLGSIQKIEDLLPYEHSKKVRDDIPVGVYQVIADFGQARGTNTATILPNDPLHSRRYGRTILLRENIMRHPRIIAAQQKTWKAVVADQFDDHLDASGNFYRTLWHEVGHYLGVERDQSGRTLALALAEYASSIEEMKADLVSLFAVHHLARDGQFDADQLRSIRASGILRTLQSNRPRSDQPYQRMQLVQFNWFLDRGLLEWDPAARELSIDYEVYEKAVTSLLSEVLALQHAGDPAAVARFFEKWTRWDGDLHGALASAIVESQDVRYRLVRYGVE